MDRSLGKRLREDNSNVEPSDSSKSRREDSTGTTGFGLGPAGRDHLRFTNMRQEQELNELHKIASNLEEVELIDNPNGEARLREFSVSNFGSAGKRHLVETAQRQELDLEASQDRGNIAFIEGNIQDSGYFFTSEGFFAKRHEPQQQEAGPSRQRDAQLDTEDSKILEHYTECILNDEKLDNFINSLEIGQKEFFSGLVSNFPMETIQQAEQVRTDQPDAGQSDHLRSPDQVEQGQATLPQRPEENRSTLRGQTTDRPNKRRGRKNASHNRGPFDVIRQHSETLNRETPRESQSQPTQEQTPVLAQTEHDQTMGPSESQSDQRSIPDLAQMFVQAVKEKRQLRGIRLTNQDYAEVNKCLERRKEMQEIDSHTYQKARTRAYASSDKGKEAQKRYHSSDQGKEAQKRYRDKLNNPSLNKERLDKKIAKENLHYNQRRSDLEQQIHKHAWAFPEAILELQHLLEQQQGLEQEWRTRKERNDTALQKATALVEIYNEVSDLVESSQRASRQQELGQTQQHQAWDLEEDFDTAAFEQSERFHEIHKQLQALLGPFPSASKNQELVPTDPSAVPPSAFERLVTAYHRLDEQLEVYLQEFAHPESLEQGNLLDF